MKSSLRTTLALFAAGLLLPVSALTAAAAPKVMAPSITNDTIASASEVLVPKKVTLDTTTAATEPIDAQLNGACGAPAVLGSVWFTFTSTGGEGAGVVLDGSASNYDLGLMVFEGEPSTSSLVACGPLQSAVATTAGTQYYVMAFTASDTGAVGGTLVLDIQAAPEPPTMEVTVEPRATAFLDGSVRLTGTYACSNALYTELFGVVTQRVGRLKISGEFYVSDLVCDGQSQPWEAYATSFNGYFAGGKAANLTMAYACGWLECADATSEHTIQLSRAKR